MKEDRIIKIISNLNDKEFVTSEELAAELNVSSKTIRNEIKNINNDLELYGAYIEIKPKHGCRLIVEDADAFASYWHELTNNEENNIPSNAKERVEFLLEHLLTTDEWVKMEELCDSLYISQSSLSLNLKEVRKYLDEYNITLLSRPGYGLKVQGSEFDIRLCLANLNFENRDELPNVFLADKQQVLYNIRSILYRTFQKYNYHMADFSFENLVIHIFIALYRAKEGCEAQLSAKQLQDLKKQEEYEIACEIIKELQDTFHLALAEDETGYIAIHLAAKKILSYQETASNVVISDEISEIVTHMLNAVHEAYQIDFSDDLELRMMLALHLVPFGVRMAYDLVLHNPLLDDIKTQYTLAYSLAVAASDVLRKHYNKVVKEDEIGYFALHFNLALERKNQQTEKKNLLVVCGTGRGTAKLLLYRFKEKFGKYLDEITTCDALGISNVDFSKIDFIVTTIPIKYPVPVPILEVKSLLSDNDVKNIQRFLNEETATSMNKYFSKELFLTDIDVNTKEEVLKLMVDKIKEVRNDIVAADFYDAIIKREQQAVTEFDNLVAIPHPFKAMTADTFVCVAILKKPIIWDKKKVQFVYLMSMEVDQDRNLNRFYKITSKFLVNKSYIKEIIQKKSFEVMMKLFASIENGLKED